MDGDFENRSNEELQALAAWIEKEIKKGEKRAEDNPQTRYSTRHGRLVVAPAASLLALRREQLEAVRAELRRRRRDNDGGAAAPRRR